MTQSRKRSAFEVICNIGSGIITSFLTWKLIVMPFAEVFKIDLNYLTVFGTIIMVSTFTIVSILRSYFWRRLFNRSDDMYIKRVG